jgi:Fe2+ or Zn2+ uptake regulation protein
MLRLRNLKVTPARIEILSRLKLAGHHGLTADELYGQLQKSKIRINRVTIYRALAQLEEANLLLSRLNGAGVRAFELETGDKHCHHHLVCESCDRVELLSSCGLSLFQAAAKKKGFSIRSHQIEIFGRCSACA